MNVNTDVKTLTATILANMSDIGKWQSDFLIENFDFQCRVRGRHNFLNMARHSDLNESTFRANYEKDFDFATFNKLLCDEYCSTERTVAFDPGVYFWSGCAAVPNGHPPYAGARHLCKPFYSIKKKQKKITLQIIYEKR